MEPECCKNCQTKYHDEGGSCKKFKNCGRWRTWFRSEWAKIRRAAANIKEKERRK